MSIRQGAGLRDRSEVGLDSRVIAWLVRWWKRASESPELHLAVATGDDTSPARRLVELVDLTDTLPCYPTAAEASRALTATTDATWPDPDPSPRHRAKLNIGFLLRRGSSCGPGGNVGGMFPMRQLDVYLNDHLAGAKVGVELSRRAANSHRGTPTGEFLQRLHGEIVEDRQTLLAVVGRSKWTLRLPSPQSRGSRRRPGDSS